VLVEQVKQKVDIELEMLSLIVDAVLLLSLKQVG